MLYLFASPFGRVVCNILDSGVIISAEPEPLDSVPELFGAGSLSGDVATSNVTGGEWASGSQTVELLRLGKERHPLLAETFRCVSTLPVGYTLQVKPPVLAPHFWSAVHAIPYGETVSYAQLALRLGLSRSYARVVGRWLSMNNHFLLLPCHRVIRGDGGLGDYRWGLERKRNILEYERNGKAG